MIRDLGIPLPPSAEQHRIVAEVERRLSVAQELDMKVEVALHRAERLRQSILKSAFEGRLVPQDPNDEPASALLERIRTARTNRRGEASRATHSSTRRARPVAVPRQRRRLMGMPRPYPRG